MKSFVKLDLSVVVLFTVLLVGQVSRGTAQDVAIGACFASRSTWFADNQHGACMYGPSLGPTGNGNFFICASSMLVFDNSADCGACYQITGPNGTSVVVTVVDQCTDGGVCNTTFPHLDLSPQAFDTLADPTVAGVINTNVQRIACPVQGGLKLRVGSNFFSPTSWEVLIFNHRLPITQVTMTYAGLSSPLSLPRQTYNYWRYDGPPVSFPVTIAVTDILGDVESFQPLTFTSGLIADSTNQFPVPSAFPGSSENGCPAPPPVVVSTGGWIYEDSLVKEFTDTDVSYINTFQWNDWSYGSTIDWESTEDPYSGSDCVQAIIGNPGGIQIGQDTSFSWASYFTSLQFAVRGSEPYSGLSVGWKGSIQVPVEVTTSWQLIVLNLATDLQTPAEIGGQVLLAFQNNLPQTSPTIFLDSIRLIPVSGTVPTVPATPSPTPTPTPTPPSDSSSDPTPSSSGSTSSTSTTGSSSSDNPPSDSTSSTSTSGSSSSETPNTPPPPSSGTESSDGSSQPSPVCTVTISQTVTGSWADSTTQYTQWGVSLLNASPQTLVAVTLQPVSSQVSDITQFWSMDESDGQFSFPSWVDLSGGVFSEKSFSWGYISTGPTPVAFSVLNASCE